MSVDSDYMWLMKHSVISTRAEQMRFVAASCVNDEVGALALNDADDLQAEADGIMLGCKRRWALEKGEAGR